MGFHATIDRPAHQEQSKLEIVREREIVREQWKYPYFVTGDNERVPHDLCEYMEYILNIRLDSYSHNIRDKFMSSHSPKHFHCDKPG